VIEFIRELFTDAAGRADEMATMCIVSALTYQGTLIYAVVWNHQAFDAQATGIGIGALIGGIAAGMGYKSKMEGVNAKPPA
jgi:hypothetical protein